MDERQFRSVPLIISPIVRDEGLIGLSQPVAPWVSPPPQQGISEHSSFPFRGRMYFQ